MGCVVTKAYSLKHWNRGGDGDRAWWADCGWGNAMEICTSSLRYVPREKATSNHHFYFTDTEMDSD